MKNSIIPKGYKLTEVGIIPVDWEVKFLKDAANIIMGQSPLGRSYNNKKQGIPLINGPTEFTAKYPIKIQWTTSPTKVCHKDDILLCIRGSSTGRINIANDIYCIGRGIASIRANLTLDHLLLNFIVEDIVKSILSFTVGSTFPNIDSKSLKNIRISLPPPPEQKRIAKALSNVDELITVIDKLITKKRKIKQGVMQQLLTGKTRLPGFTGDWEMSNFGSFACLSRVYINTQKASKSYPCIELEHLSQESGRLIGFVDSREQLSQKSMFSMGDVLFGKLRPYLKKFYFAEFYGVCSSEIWVIKALNKSIGNFIFYIVQSNRFLEIANQTSGTKMPRADWKTVSNSEYPLPPLPEQKAIAEILTNIDKEIEALENKRDKYKAIKQGMMSLLLTGKKRLKFDFND